MSPWYVRFPTLPLFYRFYTHPIGSSPSCSRERNRTMLPFERYYSYKGVIQISFILISLQHSNDDAILEGKQCCHVTMLSKYENTTYLRKLDSITRKPALVCNACHMYYTEMKLWCIFEIWSCVMRYAKIYHVHGT